MVVIPPVYIRVHFPQSSSQASENREVYLDAPQASSILDELHTSIKIIVTEKQLWLWWLLHNMASN